MTAARRITQQTERILQTLMSDPTAEWSGSQIAPIAGLKSGTLYPALLRMERYGWLTWKWEDIDPSKEGRPRRRLYTLTGTGELAAQQIANGASRRQQQRERRQGRLHPAPGGSQA
jgi:PadR family transcriptional regulator, regulatory protein PadR